MGKTEVMTSEEAVRHVKNGNRVWVAGYNYTVAGQSCQSGHWVDLETKEAWDAINVPSKEWGIDDDSNPRPLEKDDDILQGEVVLERRGGESYIIYFPQKSHKNSSFYIDAEILISRLKSGLSYIQK